MSLVFFVHRQTWCLLCIQSGAVGVCAAELACGLRLRVLFAACSALPSRVLHVVKHHNSVYLLYNSVHRHGVCRVMAGSGFRWYPVEECRHWEH